MLADGAMDGPTAEVFKGTGLLQSSAGAWPAAIITTDFCMLIFLLATLLNSSIRYYRFFIVDFFLDVEFLGLCAYMIISSTEIILLFLFQFGCPLFLFLA